MDQSVAKVLVTGANGFLASYIIRNLQNKNVQIMGMIRENANTVNLAGLDYNTVHGKITEPSDVERAVKGVDYVIHAAADTRPSLPSFRDYEAINVKASISLLEACIRNKCKKIVFVSTANTMGYGTKTNPGTGQERISPEFVKSGYAYSKWLAEEYYLKESSRGRIEIVIVNPTFMIGFNAAGGSTMKIFDLYYNSRILLTTSGGKNFIYVDDAAKAVVNALYNGKNGHRYLLANENLSYLEFYRKLDRHLGTHKLKLVIPNMIINTLGLAGSAINYLGMKASLNLTNAKILTIKNYYSSSDALTDLSMPLTSIDEVLEEFVVKKRKEVSSRNLFRETY